MIKKALLFVLAFFIATVIPCAANAQSEDIGSGSAGYAVTTSTEAPDVTLTSFDKGNSSTDKGYSYEATAASPETDVDKGYSYETTSGEETGKIALTVLAQDSMNAASIQMWVKIILGVVTLGVLYLMYFIIREFIKKR